jgi:uncharacterized protein (UPF0333 family)
MITQYNNGIRIITLGEKTTQISQVIQKGETESSGICFCNSFLVDGKPSSDGVIINIVNMQGIVSYIRALTDMLKTWEIKGSEKELEALRNSLEEIE